MTASIIQLPVRKSIIVNTSVHDAFEVFTEEIDSWWPRTHHIGKSPMVRAIVEARAGGRCYTEQLDGTECDWGRVLAWEPPSRFVFAWQITHQWGYHPDIARSSEVEVRFIPVGDATRVELEHRHFERHGDGGESMRASVDAPNGWTTLLGLYASRVKERASA
jgi:uncharacterized protein YndB with AHSA1/START domain